MTTEKANLGLATTRELLDELRARIEVDYYAGGGGLDYTTVGGRPGIERNIMPETDNEEVERSESVETHLLPDAGRIKTMPLDELKELLSSTSEWIGPGIELFRQRVEERLEADSEGGET
jgi:hypothetical protein